MSETVEDGFDPILSVTCYVRSSHQPRPPSIFEAITGPQRDVLRLWCVGYRCRMTTPGETRPCSSQSAKELSGEASRQDPGTTRGSRKSRTGCSVCKQKRRKCDETRPGCLRCRYHNIECPGYDQGIKWRPVNVPSVVRKQQNGVFW